MQKYMKTLPSYFSILPATVRYDRRLKANEKILFSEITALSNKYGFCTATNSYFEYLYQSGASTIALWLHDLRKYGYIKVFIIKNGGHRKGRRIFPVSDSTKALKETKAMVKRATPPKNKTGLKNWIGTSPRNWTGTPPKNESQPKPQSTDMAVPASRISRPNSTSSNNTSNNNYKGVRKDESFHPAKTSFPIGKINDHCLDLWGVNLSLSGTKRVTAWCTKGRDSPGLIAKAMDYTTTRIGEELYARPGISREKSALSYTYAVLKGWGYQNIHTLKELKNKAKSKYEATRQRKNDNANHKAKNHVYHNAGELKRCAQCIGYHRTGDLFSVTKDNIKVAKYMISHHMSAHDDNDIKHALEDLGGNR